MTKWKLGCTDHARELRDWIKRPKMHPYHIYCRKTIFGLQFKVVNAPDSNKFTFTELYPEFYLKYK